ncbi:Stp1/IreP family PP2C-type Ser/Thr phosphatase [Murdochiella massiliensis]|uniref:Stp1/IreP family PP2C-type Ser/Thr phosphatase n=1 Tax=Murdochiella massiliensis TaxID=1673723 RepID=UPI00082DB1C3|nr:Stp1/IreP family PP2C-type Ser/Thr phosphatase [Murdochiella massiliensis]MBY0584375.1 Stp1/IreP family PP2C-type Ser/Thr phosphatase [Murdochiella sp. Marseille-P8839]
MNTYSITDVGRVRSMNQDRYSNYFHPRFSLLLLADGMGGHNAGEVAAAMAIDACREYFMKDKERSDYEALLTEAVEAANLAVYEKGESISEYRRMGTTICAAVIADRQLTIAHVGDSRIYLFRDGKLLQLTQDHSLVADMVRQGLLTPEQALVHPDRNTLTRAVGTNETIAVDTRTLSLSAGDRLLLCSDGLTKMMDTEAIEAILAAEPVAREAAEMLVKQANDNGGADNITLTLYDIGGDDEADSAQ